jgi:hypothetical protein
MKKSLSFGVEHGNKYDGDMKSLLPIIDIVEIPVEI